MERGGYMPVYKYKALNQKGNCIINTYRANSKNEVIHMLQGMDYYPITIKRSSFLQIFYRKITSKELSIFCRQLFALFHSGIDIVRCFHALSLQTTNKNMKMILKNIEEDLEKGQTLTISLNNAKVFPKLFIHMIEAGEMSGKLDKILEKMALHYEKESKLKKKIEAAMIYPCILSMTSIIVVIFLLTYVMPNFVSMFENAGVALPLPTRILLKISSLCIDYGYVGCILFVFGVCILCYFAKKEGVQVFLDELKFKIPIVKRIIMKIVSIRFSRILSLLLASGILLITALESASKVVENKFVEKQIKKSIEEIAKGKSLANSLKYRGVFLPFMISMIEIGEESGTLDHLLEQSANFLDDEMDKTLEKILPMLEPLLIMIMSVIVGFIVFAMIMPIFDMMNTIS
jgi:type IV pilus assembly protein PilC